MRTTRVAVDVAIVGAGPAGSSLAYLLARSGVETLLIERAVDFEREFRGYGFTPGAVALFDGMGLLDRVHELDPEVVHRPSVVAFGRRYDLFDFRDAPGPGYALFVEQPPVLDLLVRAAEAFPTFTFRPGTTATALRFADDADERVAGGADDDGAEAYGGTDGDRLGDGDRPGGDDDADRPGGDDDANRPGEDDDADRPDGDDGENADRPDEDDPRAGADRSDDPDGDRGPVVGLTAVDRVAGERLVVDARLVVGADGRYSTVRAAAGIDPGLYDSDLELVWFKLPRDALDAPFAARIEDTGLLLSFGLGADAVQCGWFVEAGTYPQVRAAGVEAFRARLAAVDPDLGPALAAGLRSFDDCSLLRIEPGVSGTWTCDGLALVGDAAHVASPIGGQGNALAMQDAAVLHRVVVRALRESAAAGASGGSGAPGTADGVVPATVLARYESRRRPAVEWTVRRQRRGERVLSWLVRSTDVVPPMLRRLPIQVALWALPRLPGTRRLVARAAVGVDPVTVDAAAFVAPAPPT